LKIHPRFHAGALGGTVIADLRPGVRDEHGKVYKAGLLDDIFGVRQKTDAPEPKSGAVRISKEKFPSEFPETITDSSLELTSGKAMGGVNSQPDNCVIFNDYGKGHSLLLNFSLSKYYEKTDKNPKAAAYIEFTQNTLAFFGVKQAVTMEPPRENLRVYRFASGGGRYIGVLENLPEPIIKYALHEAAPLEKEPVTLTIPENSYIYDVRNGKYVGYGNKIKTQVKPFEAQLYSALQYKLKELKVENPDTLKQGELFKYKILYLPDEGRITGRGALHAELITPDGRAPEYYSKNIIAENGSAEGQFELALDDPPGQWKLIVKDTGTGVHKEQKFTVITR
jgi:hypothetical protein